MIILTIIAQLILRIAFFLLPIKLAIAMVNGLGYVVYFFLRLTKLKQEVSNNFDHLLTDKNNNQLADQLLLNICTGVFEVLALPFFRTKHYQTLFQFSGLEHLTEALKSNQGAIMLTMHAGNYELVPSALASLGYKVNSILRMEHGGLADILTKCRASAGVKIINILESNLYKESLNILNQNELVGFLADTGAQDGRNIEIDFLGHKVPAATGWLTLAQRAKAPVVPILTRRVGNKHLITLSQPVFVTASSKNKAIKQTTKVFEDFVKVNPEQWLIFLNTFEVNRIIKQ